MGAIAIYSSGMVTGVGFDAPSSCAAIRAGITGFVETGFTFGGDWLQGCPVTLEEPWRGVEKLRHLAVMAISECLEGLGESLAADCPILLCLAETDRPGRLMGLDVELLQDMVSDMGGTLDPRSRVFSAGRVGGVQALDYARRLIAEGASSCVIVGTDNILLRPTLTAYDNDHRLLTADNTNGFIPGEAAAAILVGPVKRQKEAQMLCLGLGFGTEPAPMGSEEPFRAEGLTEAVQAAFLDGRCSYDDVDIRITDNNGEFYGFKEAALALTRTLRGRKDTFDIWHPAECVGEVGAAVVPLLIGVTQVAQAKGYAPGPGVLCQFSGGDEVRAAVILRYRSWGED